MAITSHGYDGTINEAQWATVAHYLGSGVPGVSEVDAWRVTAGGSGSRAVTVAGASGNGPAFGWGIVDFNTTNINLNAAAQSSGTRWDTVCLRRDWTGVGGTTTTVIVQGGSSAVVAAGIQRTPGVVADQPLALIQVTTSTSIGSVIDLRPVVEKVVAVTTQSALPDPDLLDYAEAYGMLALVRGFALNTPAVPYTLAGGTSEPVWVPMLDPPTWQPILLSAGISQGSRPLRYRVHGGQVQFSGSVTKTSGTWPASSWVSIGAVPAGGRPTASLRVPCALAGAGPNGSIAEFQADGSVLFYNPVAGTDSVFIETTIPLT